MKQTNTKYRLDEIAICNYTQDHVFPIKEARRLDYLLFCSKECKDSYKKDYGI